MDKFDPESDGGQVEHAEEALGELVVAGGDGAIGLEVSDLAFDAAAQSIEASVPARRLAMVRARGNDGADAAALEIGANLGAVVGLVGDQRRGPRLGQVDQDRVGLRIVRLPAREVEGERPAAGVSETMNLTGEPAPRAAKSLFASPPFAPAAWGWPRTVVESML